MIVNNDKSELVSNLDLKSITNKLISNHKWSKEDAATCERLYKNFLLLKYKYQNKFLLAPTDEIDIFWHEHILDTKKYMHDCDTIFGEYLHHNPNIGIAGSEIDEAGAQKIFDNTQKLHQDEFGYPMFKIRLSILDLIKSIPKFYFKKFVSK